MWTFGWSWSGVPVQKVTIVRHIWFLLHGNSNAQLCCWAMISSRYRRSACFHSNNKKENVPIQLMNHLCLHFPRFQQTPPVSWGGLSLWSCPWCLPAASTFLCLLLFSFDWITSLLTNQQLATARVEISAKNQPVWSETGQTKPYFLPITVKSFCDLMQSNKGMTLINDKHDRGGFLLMEEKIAITYVRICGRRAKTLNISIWAESVSPQITFVPAITRLYSTPSFPTRCLLTSCAQMAGRNWWDGFVWRVRVLKHPELADVHRVGWRDRLQWGSGAFVPESKDVVLLVSIRTRASTQNRCPDLTCDWRQTWPMARKGQECGCFFLL